MVVTLTEIINSRAVIGNVLFERIVSPIPLDILEKVVSAPDDGTILSITSVIRNEGAKGSPTILSTRVGFDSGLN